MFFKRRQIKALRDENKELKRKLGMKVRCKNCGDA